MSQALSLWRPPPNPRGRSLSPVFKIYELILPDLEASIFTHLPISLSPNVSIL